MAEYTYYGSEMQDLWAFKMLGKNQTFLDVGCGGPIHCNNTYMLEKEGWKGICIDSRLKVDGKNLSSFYKKERKSKLFRLDSTTEKFIVTLNENYSNRLIDYISLDVDESGLDTLKNLLNNGYNFKCMTFEHDLYQRGGLNRLMKFESKDILLKRGYFPLFENVCLNYSVDLQRGVKPWEDWWVNLNYFSHLLDIGGVGLYYENCIDQLFNFLNKTQVAK